MRRVIDGSCLPSSSVSKFEKARSTILTSVQRGVATAKLLVCVSLRWDHVDRSLRPHNAHARTDSHGCDALISTSSWIIGGCHPRRAS